MAMAIAMAMSMAMAMAKAMAVAMALAVIGLSMRTGADLHENQLFIEKQYFGPNLIISGPFRFQKWIWLQILRWKIV